MSDIRTAKLFQNGASQAVRLPAEFRFSGTQVYVSRDERTGDVILSSRPAARDWAEFCELTGEIKGTDAFMAERPLNTAPKHRKIFEDEA
ncbi:antitoxin [Bosea vaviloviae]|uniref:AbrB family transcriptional regulator n=1 Tax=Bosea vaviloviae TaxID=1526658 RepID=A0A1D7U2U0_9HYPH|nr:AbrB/MazE/SpoVT family DNA-binding domain-containing protein [Bosea vaviloviae]AOO81694.1 AbrB family transcriptional regulator [Bosea vaviloviae]